MSDARTSPPRPRVVALQIKLPCATREELKKEHGLELSKGTFFVRTRAPKPQNTLVRFELRLEQGEPFLRGLGVVTRSTTEAEQPGQSGMLLQLRGLDASSHLFLQNIGLRVALPTIRAGVAGDPESRRFLQEPPQPSLDELIEARPKPARTTQSSFAPVPVGGHTGPHTRSSELPRAAPPPQSIAPRPRAVPPPTSSVGKSSITSGVTKSGVSKSSVTKSGVTRSGITKPRLSAPPRSGPVVGIDFGTTQTSVAWFSNDSAQIVSSKEGESRLQSLFGVDAKGFPLVGAQARKAVVQAPQNAVRNSRRLLGLPALSETVEAFQKNVPYPLVPGKNGQLAATLAGHPFAIEDVASRLIGETAGWAEARVGRPVGRVVVTVPGAATVNLRQATKDAAELAGLTVERLIAEPVAVALSYTSTRAADQKLAVIRLGAGSFDVAILQQKGKTGLELLAIGGDPTLGGGDFDQLLLEVMLKRFEEEQGVSIADNPVLVQRFADATELAKIALSTKELYNIGIPFIALAPKHSVDFDSAVTRTEFEQLVLPLTERAIQLINEALTTAKVRPAEIGELLIVGGQGRMPFLQTRLKELFGREPARNVHPEEAAALGAAILAHRIETRTLDGLRLDMLPSNLGVGLPGGAFQTLFERWAVPPRTVTHTVATETDNQTAIELCFFQGDSERALDNDFVGYVRVEDLPPGPARSVKMDFVLELTADGTLSVQLKEADGTQVPLLLEFGRSPDQLRTFLGDKGPPAKRGGRVWKAVRGLFQRKKKA